MSDLFLKILNFSINASWLIIVVFILRKIFRKAPKWIFCVLWALVAVRLICPVTLKSILSLLPSSEVIPLNIAFSQQPVINTGIAVINNAVNPVISGTFAPEPASSINPLQVVTYMASIVWMTGMAAMVIYALISYIRLKRKVRMSVPVDRDTLTGVCETTDAVRNIRTCDEIRTPFILGLFRPVIYVPSSVEGRARELVIAHEAAHLKRHDHWWKPLGFLLLTVYWFNPLCWFAYILLCRDIEAACDEKVIREKDRDYIADYSQTLLDLSMPGKMVSACPLAFGETGVKSRVKGVLNYKKPAFWLILAAVICCIAAGVCFLTDPVSATVSDSGSQLPEYIAWKPEKTGIYYYSKNEIDGKTLIDFSITLEPDGTFTWYETPISSFIGMGKYKINNGILYLENDEEMTGNSDINKFRIKGDRLYFIAEGSSNFPYVKLEDGAEFVYGINPVADWWEQLPEEQEDQYGTDEQLNQAEAVAEPITYIPEETDVKEKFLRWRLTTNLNDRWTIYQNEMDSVFPFENDPAAGDISGEGTFEAEEIPTGIVMPSAELQEQIDAAAAGYYSAITEFTSAELIRNLINNRTPMSEDSLYLEYGASMEFVDVTFGEGKEDTFVSGLIYDFDARVIVNGYENLPDYQYKQDEDGYFHITGQITVDEGLVTKVYLSKP